MAINPMISAGTHTGVWIDLGKDEPGMVLQRRDREGGMYIWNEYVVNGEPVIAPIKIDTLLPGKYRLV